MIKKFLKDHKVPILSYSLISLFTFLILFNKYLFLSKKINIYLISVPSFFLLSFCMIYFLFIINLNTNYQKIRQFYKDHYNFVNSIFLLLIFYLISYILIPTNSVTHSNTLKFFFGEGEIYNFIFRNILFIFFCFFLLNSFFINQFKIGLKEANKILFNFSIFFLVLAFAQVLIELFASHKFYSTFISDRNNCVYFQFLPFGNSGKRHYEIIPFLLGYAITLGQYKKKIEYLNLLFFCACFFSFSKNAWVSLFLINIIYFFSTNIRFFLKKILIKFLSLIIFIFLFDLAYTSVKKCETNLIYYTSVKVLFINNLFKNENLDNIKKDYIKNLTSNFNLPKKYSDNPATEIEMIDYLLDSTPKRIDVYKESLEKIKNKIFFGYGSNNFILENNKSSNPESEILKILLDGGIIGLFLWLNFYYQLLINAKSKYSFYILMIFLFMCLFNVYSWFVLVYYLLPFTISPLNKDLKKLALLKYLK